MMLKYFFSATLSRSSTFCAIFTAMKQFRAEQSADVFQLVKSFYNNNPGLTYNMVILYGTLLCYLNKDNSRCFGTS